VEYTLFFMILMLGCEYFGLARVTCHDRVPGKARADVLLTCPGNFVFLAGGESFLLRNNFTLRRQLRVVQFPWHGVFSCSAYDASMTTPAEHRYVVGGRPLGWFLLLLAFAFGLIATLYAGGVITGAWAWTFPAALTTLILSFLIP
jgi:hypothetical protein